jgi:hypothetical protein
MEKKVMAYLCIGLILLCLALFLTVFMAIGPVILVLIGCWLIYHFVLFIFEYFYYKSKKFIEIKDSIKENTKKCNELNQHIEDLKYAYVDIKSIDYGQATYTDQSNFNYKRPKLENLQREDNIYDCSSTVCKNAQAQPFKYICKYFDIKINEETLSNFENVLNNFSAAEEGKILLQRERDQILESISAKIPFWIRAFRKEKLIRKLGFDDIDFSQFYFPEYTFRYVSPGGNSSMSCGTVFDIDNLNRFIDYLSGLIKFKKSIAGQRALMTSALRERIKIRDNYTCKYCDLSTTQEPNLLLEIDHIIPLSKNGITSEDNLQTLCWKCNRSKGNKIVEN